MLRRKKFLIGGIIVFLAIGSLVFTSFQSFAIYFYTVSELAGQGSTIYGEDVRVKGEVAVGSVEQESLGGQLRFTMIDGEESLPVVYQGIVPDIFKVGIEVIVEGQIDSDGIFQAHTLMPQCPSRYVPE